MNSANLNVLVVDDDADIRYAIANILRKCDCIVAEAGSVEEAIDELQAADYQIIFSDIRFHGELGGVDLLAHVVENLLDVRVVLVSCTMNGKQKAELQAKGADWCLQKPFFRDTCLQVLGCLGFDQQQAA